MLGSMQLIHIIICDFLGEDSHCTNKIVWLFIYAYKGGAGQNDVHGHLWCYVCPKSSLQSTTICGVVCLKPSLQSMVICGVVCLVHSTWPSVVVLCVPKSSPQSTTVCGVVCLKPSPQSMGVCGVVCLVHSPWPSVVLCVH